MRTLKIQLERRDRVREQGEWRREREGGEREREGVVPDQGSEGGYTVQTNTEEVKGKRHGNKRQSCVDMLP